MNSPSPEKEHFFHCDLQDREWIGVNVYECEQRERERERGGGRRTEGGREGDGMSESE